MSVHIDRAHHHPSVYKRDGLWHASCSRCGHIYTSFPWMGSLGWRLTVIASLHHAKETLS